MSDQDNDTDEFKFDYVNNHEIALSVVKLTFSKKNDPYVGTGFFINLPNVEDYHVILTAAHNLTSADGTRASDLQVVFHEIDAYGGTKVQKVQISGGDDIYISSAYTQEGIPETDYGAIRIKKMSKSQRGFSYSMALASRDLLNADLIVAGHDPPPTGIPNDVLMPPCLRRGPCSGCPAERVEYRANTIKGISGSPVLIRFKKQAVAIAIHNNGADPKIKGGSSRGVRLTPKLLSEIFDWLGPTVRQKDVQLRANDTRSREPILPGRGLFLSFLGNIGFGRVRLGSGTKFNVVPAEVVSNQVHYAIAVAGKDEWVMFKPKEDMVVLTKNMTDACLFKTFPLKNNKSIFKMSIEQGENFRLRFESMSIKEYDDDAETSEVSFMNFVTGDEFKFTRFSFE